MIYKNPLPQLRSRRAYFPGLTSLPGGGFLASFALGEAMESADQSTVLYRGDADGRAWREAGCLIPAENRGAWSDCAKVTALPDGRQIALGYRFDRSRPDLPVGNPQTGGLLADEVFFCERPDGEAAWSAPRAFKRLQLPGGGLGALTALEAVPGRRPSPISWTGRATPREALRGAAQERGRRVQLDG